MGWLWLFSSQRVYSLYADIAVLIPVSCLLVTGGRSLVDMQVNVSTVTRCAGMAMWLRNSDPGSNPFWLNFLLKSCGLWTLSSVVR